MNSRSQQAMPQKPTTEEPELRVGTYGTGPGGIPVKTFQPFGVFVCIHDLTPKATPGGLVMPDGSGIRTGVLETNVALVIACGPECKQVKEGDVVLIGQEVRVLSVIHKGNKTFLIREDHISGVVKTTEQFAEMEAAKP